MNSGHESGKSKLLSFEGLRGIAAIVVLIHHLRLTFYPGDKFYAAEFLSFLPPPLFFLWRSLIEGLVNGTFAVAVFWVMSAFVLSLQFFSKSKTHSGADAHDYLEKAALRRYPRLLLPVLASVLFAYVLFSAGLMRNMAMAHVLGPPYEPGWLSSWYAFRPSFHGAIKSAFWGSFFKFEFPTTYNNVLWTMEPEYLGSMFLFSFLALFGHRQSRFLVYPIAAIIIFNCHIDWLQAFIGGILLCDLFVNGGPGYLQSILRSPFFGKIRESRVFALLGWIVVITGAGQENYSGVFYPIIACIAVCLTLVSLPTKRFFSGSLAVYLGGISFGLYLTHIPIICSFTCASYLFCFHLLGHDMAAIVVSLATCALAIAAGHLLHAWVDKPSIRFSRMLSDKLISPNWHKFSPDIFRKTGKGPDSK